jgi:LysR family transcriptional regulator, cyn operon transcriptional activator
MNLRHLRAFVEIAESGGVVRAAARLHMTQPTVSRQLHALEVELGVPLFDRIGRRVQLTSEGEDLLQRSRRLLSDAEAIAERARALKSGQTGVLRVGAPPQLIESMMVAFIARYKRRHPGVEIKLTEDGGVRLPMRLERGDVQLAIIPDGDDRFEGRLLFPIYVLAVMATDYRLRRRAVLDVVDLVGDPLLLLTRAFATREWFHVACQAAHIRPNIVFESAAPQTIIALAAGGHGIAVVPRGVLIPRAKVHAAPLVYRGVPIGRWQTVAWDPQRFLSPYAAQFVEELVAYTRRSYPNRNITRRAPPLPRPNQPVS